MDEQKLCRICLLSRKSEDVLDIFTQPVLWTTTIAQTIMECAPVTIVSEDGFPKLICKPCLNDLTVAHRFYKLCLHSNKILKIQVTNEQELDNRISNIKNEAIIKSDYSEENGSCGPDLTDYLIPLSPEIKPIKSSFLCVICDINFKTRRGLLQHERKRHRQKISYKCEVCEESFSFKSKYYAHVKSHNVAAVSDNQSDKPHKCSYCEKTFKTQREARIHERVHTGERPYVCDVCGKAFATLSTFTSHKNIHTGIRPYKCEVCGTSRISADELKRHMRVHSDTYLYKCDICNKEFKWSSNKVKHMRRHRGERNYKCNYCEKGFYDTYKLKEHLVVHTGERPFSCLLCERTFRHASHLRKHHRRYHKT